MMNIVKAIKAIKKEGNVEPLHIPDGAELLVTILSNKKEFLLQADETVSASIWDNKEDDVYAQLLKR